MRQLLGFVNWVDYDRSIASILEDVTEDLLSKIMYLAFWNQ